MLKEIQLPDFKIEPLGIINLFVGYNRCGKSTLFNYLQKLDIPKFIYSTLMQNEKFLLNLYNSLDDKTLTNKLLSLVDFNLEKDSFSDSVFYLFSLGIYLSTLNGSYLIIENLEGNLHDSLFSSLFPIMYDYLKEKNIQLFTTTNNYFLLTSMVEFMQKLPEDLMVDFCVHRVEKDNNGNVKTIYYPPNCLIYSVDHNFRVF